MANFRISVRKDLAKVIFPIFDKYPLRTSKYYYYLRFKKAHHILENPLLTSEEKFNLIESLLKEPIPDDYVSPALYYLDPSLSSYKEIESIITDQWLVGFVEADGSFGIIPDSSQQYFDIEFSLTQNLDITLLELIRRKLHIPGGLRRPKAPRLPRGPVYAKHTPRCTPLAPKAYRIDIIDTVSTYPDDIKDITPFGGTSIDAGYSMYAKYGAAPIGPAMYPRGVPCKVWLATQGWARIKDTIVHTQYTPASPGTVCIYPLVVHSTMGIAISKTPSKRVGIRRIPSVRTTNGNYVPRASPISIDIALHPFGVPYKVWPGCMVPVDILHSKYNNIHNNNVTLDTNIDTVSRHNIVLKTKNKRAIYNIKDMFEGKFKGIKSLEFKLWCKALYYRETNPVKAKYIYTIFKSHKAKI